MLNNHLVMKEFKTLLMIGLAAGLWSSCEGPGNNLGSLSVSVTSDMVCKVTDPLKSGDPSPESTCIKYSYDGSGLLTLTHYNAAFNCCPEKFTVDIEVKGDSLIILEEEKKQGCKCNCLFYLELKVENLPADTYHIRFVEPYVRQGIPELTFDLDLKKEPEGQYCITRPAGWWM